MVGLWKWVAWGWCQVSCLEVWSRLRWLLLKLTKHWVFQIYHQKFHEKLKLEWNCCSLHFQICCGRNLWWFKQSTFSWGLILAQISLQCPTSWEDDVIEEKLKHYCNPLIKKVKEKKLTKRKFKKREKRFREWKY